MRWGRIILKSRREVDKMRQANAHSAEILAMMCEAVAPGISTWDLDQIARREIARRPVESAFLGYNGFTGTICASINEEIVHGIPRRDKIIEAGDIVSLDFGVSFEGYVGDTAVTIGVGDIDAQSQMLVDTTRASLERAIAVCTPAHRLSDIGQAVQETAEAAGLGIVRDFVGHGIGTRMHEDPQVPNYYDGPKPRLRAGMVIAVEPMLNLGSHKVRMLDDGWTAVTADGRRSAHFEHSIAILEDGPWVLSQI